MEEKSKIYVGNLDYGVTEDDLKTLFEEKGLKTKDTAVIKDKYSGRSKGFGFVEMADAASAQAAISELDGYELEGRAIKVNEAKPREDRPARPRY